MAKTENQPRANSNNYDARVRMSVACKRAARGCPTWVTWRGERLRLGPIPVTWHSGMTIVYVRSGRFHVAEIGLRKDCLPLLDDGYRVQLRQVRALVLERHPRTA